MREATNNAAEALDAMRDKVAFDLLRIGKLADMASVLAGDLLSDRDQIVTAVSCISELRKKVEDTIEKAVKDARAQGAQEAGSAQPHTDAANAAPAPVDAGTAASAAYSVSVLWQMIMDELGNAKVADATTPIDRSLICLDSMNDKLAIMRAFIDTTEAREARHG